MANEPQDIYNPQYWRNRLKKTTEADRHKAVFITGIDNWKAIEAAHRKILDRLILPGENILDCGCGWGRLLELLPKRWFGEYVGIDLSPDFIKLATDKYPDHNFYEGPLEIILPQITDTMNLSDPNSQRFDWAVMISVRPMIRRNCGDKVWDEIEKLVRPMTRRMLFLEYDPFDDGEIVII